MKIKHNNMTRFLSLAFLVASAAWWTGCKRIQAEDTDKETFVLSDTMLQSIHIDTAAVKPVQSDLRLSGKVAPDVGKVLKVYPRERIRKGYQSTARRLRTERPDTGGDTER